MVEHDVMCQRLYAVEICNRYRTSLSSKVSSYNHSKPL